MPVSASRPNVNINNATSDWLTATAWPHLIGWCKKIRKADWLMMTSDAVENEWKYPICPAKNPALSGYKIKFLYIFIWVNMLRHRFAAAFGGSFAHGSAINFSIKKHCGALSSQVRKRKLEKMKKELQVYQKSHIYSCTSAYERPLNPSILLSI